jgi:mersacidin/lichenicidin family type 2 lantibiotic
MSKSKVIRAWKDPSYRNSLSQAEREAIPANPAGMIEISDADLGKVAGGRPINTLDCTQNHYCITHLFYCYTLLIC